MRVKNDMYNKLNGKRRFIVIHNKRTDIRTGTQVGTESSRRQSPTLLLDCLVDFDKLL